MVTELVKPHGSTKGMARLFFIRKQVMRAIEECNPTMVVIEGYAMGVRGGGRVFDLGELGGVLKLALWEDGFDTLTVPPSSLKSLIALSGKADKGRMRKALALYYGLNIRNDNEVDAASLVLVGEAYAGKRLLHGFTAESMDTLDKCTMLKGRTLTG